MCKEQVEWAKTEKRTFLRQRIEARLANLYLGGKEFSAALALISRLLSEVRMPRAYRCSWRYPAASAGTACSDRGPVTAD